MLPISLSALSTCPCAGHYYITTSAGQGRLWRMTWGWSLCTLYISVTNGGLSDGCLTNHRPGTLGNNNHGQHVVCINVMRFHFSTTAPIIRRKTRPDRHNVRIKINNIIMINVRLQQQSILSFRISPRIVLSLIKPLIQYNSSKNPFEEESSEKVIRTFFWTWSR